MGKGDLGGHRREGRGKRFFKKEPSCIMYPLPKMFINCTYCKQVLKIKKMCCVCTPPPHKNVNITYYKYVLFLKNNKSVNIENNFSY